MEPNDYSVLVVQKLGVSGTAQRLELPCLLLRAPRFVSINRSAVSLLSGLRACSVCSGHGSKHLHECFLGWRRCEAYAPAARLRVRCTVERGPKNKCINVFEQRVTAMEIESLPF